MSSIPNWRIRPRIEANRQAKIQREFQIDTMIACANMQRPHVTIQVRHLDARCNRFFDLRLQLDFHFFEAVVREHTGNIRPKITTFVG